MSSAHQPDPHTPDPVVLSDRRTASSITDPELDQLYARVDLLNEILRVVGLPPGVVPGDAGRSGRP